MSTCAPLRIAMQLFFFIQAAYYHSGADARSGREL